MNSHAWQLTAPLDAMIFDCDATLSEIEGINFLTQLNNAAEKVTVLTDRAMSQTGINQELYTERLSLVKPTSAQVNQLGLAYYEQTAPDAIVVLSILKRLGKSIYLFSAGVNPAVQWFGEKIGFPAEHIFAVDLHFDNQGNYLDFDRLSPLTMHGGKKVLLKNILNQHKRIGYVGDGMNDASVADQVARFVGYGGVCYRKAVRDLSDFYVTTRSFLPLLPLWLTQQECDKLTSEEKVLYEKGVILLSSVERGVHESQSR